MRKIKLCVVGANGRMGQSILGLAQDGSDFSPELGVVSKGDAKGFKASTSDLKRVRQKPDLVIDFSTPDMLEETLHFCSTNKIPVVIGTTGISDSHRKAIKNAGKKTAVLYSANMSLGIAALNRAIQCMGMLEGFDFQIEETHHTKKKDAPSGTALLLQSTLEKTIGRSAPKPLSIRIGGVFGNHRVIAGSQNEVLVFEHSALNRTVFAEGALKAGLWLLDQKPGLYSMDDLFGGQ